MLPATCSKQGVLLAEWTATVLVIIPEAGKGMDNTVYSPPSFIVKKEFKTTIIFDSLYM